MLLFDIHVTSGGSSGTVPVRVPVSQLGHWAETGAVAIKATYFSADTAPIGFIALPPTDSKASRKAPNPPILALRSYLCVIYFTSRGLLARTDGAGVDILKQPFWAEALPRQQRSWFILSSGRTPWACGLMPLSNLL